LIEFPDVNVLVALFDGRHAHHLTAKAWLANARSTGWATCPMTQNGMVRTLCNPKVTSLQLNAYQAAEGLCRSIIDSGNNHHFWTDTVTFCDASIFDLAQVKGYKQLTDIYLLGLCQAHNATLVTLDTAIPTMLPCIVNPIPNLVRLLP
jgi:uncharacterized protein